MHVAEATPSPLPGPERDALAAEQELRARFAENALTTAIESYLDRAFGVIRSRLTGPRARKGTRFWEDRGEVKAAPVRGLDPGYIVPDNIADQLADDLHAVSLRVATSTAKGTQKRLGGQGLSEVDMDDIGDAISVAVERLLGVAARHAEEIRAAILDADASAESLDEVLDRIEAAHRRGGNWLRLGGATLAHALANEVAYRTALAAGCTHRQWISRRDPAVRPTHVRADGQVRPMSDKFKVGLFELLYPGDPAELPASWGEIANCRCGMLFSGNSEQAQRESALLNAQAISQAAARRAATTLNAAVTQPQAGQLASVPMVILPAPVAAYRALAAPVEVVPGQVLRMGQAVPLVLSLIAPPVLTGGVLLAILLPAGAQVAVSAAGVALPADAVLEVISVTAEQIQARYAGAPTP